MVETLAIVGGTAKQFGLDIEKTSSLANAFISLGKTPEKAATAINPNYGLASKERHRNRGLFRLHGIGNQNRKNMN